MAVEWRRHTMNQSEEILALNKVSKRFPGVLALDNVSFSLR